MTIIHGEIDQRLRIIKITAGADDTLPLFLQRWFFDNAIQAIVVAHPRRF